MSTKASLSPKGYINLQMPGSFPLSHSLEQWLYIRDNIQEILDFAKANETAIVERLVEREEVDAMADAKGLKGTAKANFVQAYYDAKKPTKTASPKSAMVSSLLARIN